jgi:hypothetical protein
MIRKFFIGGVLAVALTWAMPSFAETTTVNDGTNIAAASDTWVAARRRRRVRRGSTSTPKVAPRPTPRRWTYMAQRMRPPRNDKWKGRWNDVGMQGWELVAVQENFFIFKRPSDYPSAYSAPTSAPTPKATPKTTKSRSKKRK